MSRTVGLHGRTLLRLFYRFGALTRSQLMRLTGLHPSAVDRQLRHLRRAGYVDRVRDVASWKETAENAHTGYYLTLPAGVRTAAFYSGIENDVLSLKHYRRCGLPAKVAHRLLANEHLLSLTGAEEVYSEACPDFPLFGSGTPRSDRSDTRYRFVRIVPDGTFTLDGRTYLLETETGTHARKELVAKLNDYASRWRRMLKPNRGEKKYHDPGARPEPVVLLTPDSEHKRMRDYLRENLPKAPDWGAATEAIRDASGGRAHPLQLVVVAGIDEVRANPLGRVYRPLKKYPPECSDASPDGTPGWRVSLADAAEISSRIPVPEDPPEEVLEENPLGDEKKKEGAA